MQYGAVLSLAEAINVVGNLLSQQHKTRELFGSGSITEQKLFDTLDSIAVRMDQPLLYGLNWFVSPDRRVFIGKDISYEGKFRPIATLDILLQDDPFVKDIQGRLSQLGLVGKFYLGYPICQHSTLDKL